MKTMKIWTVENEIGIVYSYWSSVDKAQAARLRYRRFFHRRKTDPPLQVISHDINVDGFTKRRKHARR